MRSLPRQVCVARNAPETKTDTPVTTASPQEEPVSPTMPTERASDIIAAATAKSNRPKRKAESTDAVATFMTRRFGCVRGKGWRRGSCGVGGGGESCQRGVVQHVPADSSSPAVATTPMILSTDFEPFPSCSIAGGLAWLGFLTIGTLGEQVRRPGMNGLACSTDVQTAEMRAGGASS